MQIEELLVALQKNPEKFIDEERIEYIYHFLGGYCYGGAESGLGKEDLNRRFSGWFWNWLLKWIRKNVNVKYTPKAAIWSDDIKAIAGGEEKEVPLFYELCGYFFEDYRKKRGYFSWRK